MMNNEQFSGQNNTEQIMTGQNISEQRSALKAGKTIPQIILGSAIWTCILAYILILAGQLIGELAVLASGALKSDLGTTAGLYFSFAGIWLVLFLNALIKKNRPLFKAYGTGCTFHYPLYRCLRAVGGGRNDLPRLHLSACPAHLQRQILAGGAHQFRLLRSDPPGK